MSMSIAILYVYYVYAIEGPFAMQVICPSDQWPFQDPKLKVRTTYKAYVLGLCKRISPQNTALYGAVPPF